MRHNPSRRSRSRNRKGPNPMTRTFESNGPDVKVRGTAAHIAEKYMALARDAQSSGDPVAAENYFQHAEHYNRIVMAAQAQFQQSQPPQHRIADDDEDGMPERDGRYSGWNGWDGAAPRGQVGDDERLDDEEPPRPDRGDNRGDSRGDIHRGDGPRQARDEPPRGNRDRFPPRDAAAPQGEGGRQDARQGDNGRSRQPQMDEERNGDGASAGLADETRPAQGMDDGERRRLPRRRRPKPAVPGAVAEGEAAADEAAGPTRDGEAALAAFRD
jgi:hypothetical protein